MTQQIRGFALRRLDTYGWMDAETRAVAKYKVSNPPIAPPPLPRN